MLESHESEPAHALKREIRSRLAAGESAAQIEHDLVGRYGESIVAVPVESDPRGPLSASLLAGLLVTAAGLVGFGLRWVRRSRGAVSELPAPSVAPVSETLDARIDAELERYADPTRG
jgi:cytochrome c-type biogenesis protein CcmH